MNVRQIIVMRKDLNMRKGKMVAQGAHASMAVLLDRLQKSNLQTPGVLGELHALLGNSKNDLALREWISGLFTKICCSVDSEEGLLEVYNTAKEAGLPCALITDAGLTEFGGVPTITCCAIGPAEQEVLQPITGHLKLL